MAGYEKFRSITGIALGLVLCLSCQAHPVVFLILCASRLINAEEADACKTTFSNSTGSIPVTKFQPGINCTWRFNLTSNASIYINFMHTFSISLGATLQILNGDNKPIATLTGPQDEFLAVITKPENATIMFLNGNSASYFGMTYSTTKCSQTVSWDAATIRSPYVPVDSGSVSCQYTIKTDNASFPFLSFSVFDFTKMTMEVFGKKSPASSSSDDLLKNLTGQSSRPDDIMSFANTMTIQLTLPLAQKQTGFVASYASVSQSCSGIYEIGEETPFFIPPFGNYSNNLDCRGMAYLNDTMKQRFSLTLILNSLDLGDEYDTIVVNDGGSRFSPTLTTWKRGTTAGSVLVSSTGKLWMMFKTDETQTGRGVHFTVRPQAVGGVLRGSGHIKVQNYSMTVNTTNPIYYLLSVEEGKQVVFKITEKYLFPAASIICHDGTQTTDPVVGNFSSHVEFHPVFSSGQNLLVVIQNVEGPQQFLMANFTSAPAGTNKHSTSADDTYQLQAPATNASMNATWLIHPIPDSENVTMIKTIKLSSLSLPQDSVLTVRRGVSDESPVLFTLRGEDQQWAPEIAVLSSDGARLDYMQVATNSSVNSTDEDTSVTPQLLFTASYRTAPACNAVLDGKSGTFTSPNFPDSYPLNAWCLWVIKLTDQKEKLVHLSFDTFHLATPHYVKVMRAVHQNGTNGSEPDTIGQYSGDVIPNDVISSGEELWVWFLSKSRSTSVKQGVNVSYELIDCGGNITNISEIATPGYPKPVSKNTTCVWIVTLPPKTGNSTVNIISFDYEIHNFMNATGNLFEIRDGGSSQSPLVQMNYKNGKSPSILSTSNVLWIKYRYQHLSGPEVPAGFAFRMDYKIKECPPSDQCDNGKCIHADWKCDGIYQCQDRSDEKGCAKPGTLSSGAVSYLALALSILGSLVAGFLIACLIPYCYKRYRFARYSELLSPVPT